MAGRVEGKVALITGGARGQGRSHAVRLAEEGASIVVVDIAGPVETVEYDGATETDLKETVRLVEETGAKVASYIADVRDLEALEEVAKSAVGEFGGIDIVAANAGITTYRSFLDLTTPQWQTMLDVNLTGVYNTVKAVLPSMIAAGNGGSIIITSSINGLKGMANCAHYTAAKHGLVGLMRCIVAEVSVHNIRVNTVHPTSVATPMILNDTTYRLFRPDLEAPTVADTIEGFTALQQLPIPWIEAIDVSNAVLWLASDEARYVTGVTLPIDAGCLTK